MRIGLLTTSFPRHDHDIAGHFVLGFARALAARGHAIDVLAPEPTDPLGAPSWPGVSVRWVPYLRPRSLQRTFYGSGVPDNLARDPRAWLGLAPFVAALGHSAQRHNRTWDALCSHWALPCGLVGASLARAGRPHLTVLHSADLHLLAALPGRGRIASHLLSGSSTLSFVSSAQRDVFLGLLPAPDAKRAETKCHVQPMGVDVVPEGSASPAALRAQLGLARFSVLSLSRLLPIKGLDVVIRACAGTRGLELIVAGEGPERMPLEALAHRLQAPVRFVGLVTGSHKADWLRAADAFVCSSRTLSSGRSEGMPTALLEAQAAGLPTVASDVGGIREHLGSSALVVPPDDPEALRQALLRLRDEPDLRAHLSHAARSVGATHQWPVIAPRVEAWLRR